MMDEEEKKELEEKTKKKKPVNEELSECTTAPSAEHARGSDDDEPCDDGRSG